MAFNSDTNYKSVLQVVTYIGTRGEYGGPVTVARNLLNEIGLNGMKVTLIGATTETNFDQIYEGHNEIRIKSHVYLRKYRFSSIFSGRFALRLLHEVKNHDVVHVHFARDMVPITAATFALFFRKKLVIQPHGMINKDTRIAVRFVDVIVKLIAKKSNAILVLTDTELKNLQSAGITGKFIIFRNGLPAQKKIAMESKRQKNQSEIIFFSRINKTKRPEIVVEIAERFRKIHPEIHFTIYGPDDGALEDLLLAIKSFKISDTVKYGGALNPTEISRVIQDCSLVLLPSIRDPYPMVVLESLRCGKPIVVSPDCGQAELLTKYDKRLVAEGFLPTDYIKKMEQIIEANYLHDEVEMLLNIFEQEFNIESIVARLIEIYFDE